MHFSDKFIERPVLSIALSLLIVLFGIYSLYQTNFRQYPKMTNTVVEVSTAYYGASAELIEGFVTRPIEQAIAQADNIDYMVSDSAVGRSTINVHMKLNTNPDNALANILSKVNSVRSKLPSQIQDPAISYSAGASTSLFYIAFTSTSLTSSILTDYLKRNVQPQLLSSEGVAKADLFGGSDFALRVWLNPMKMTSYNLSVDDVLYILKKNNIQSSTGKINNYFIQYNTDINSQVKTPEAMSRLIIKTNSDGSVLHLNDIATVSLSKNRDFIRAYANGEKAVIIGINSSPEANPLSVVKAVEKKLPEIKKNLLPGIKMNILYDATKSINDSIDEVLITILEAIFTVVLVTLLFMGSLRAVLIPVITIPLSLIGVVMMMKVCGCSLNLLTLLAMVLAIGLVVDDAIVVVENVERHIKNGLSPYRAAIKGTREIAMPVIYMTLTLVTVYSPIAFMQGITGSLFSEFAITLAGAVLVSGVVALTLSPMMCSKMLKQSSEFNWYERKVEAALQCISRGYKKSLSAVIENRSVIVSFSIIVFLTIPFLLKFIKAELTPTEDKGAFMLMANAPESVNLDYIENGMREVMGVVKKLPDMHSTVALSGIPSSNSGLALGILKPFSERTLSQKSIIQQATNKLSSIPLLSVSAFAIPELPGAGGGLPVQLMIKTTKEFKYLYLKALSISTQISKNPMFVFTKLDLNFSSANIAISIDRAKAGAYGVTMQDIGNTLSGFMNDFFINQINLDGQSYEVIAQVKRKYRFTPNALSGYYVKSKAGTMIPLTSLVSVAISGKPQSLTHLDQMNSASIGIVPAPGFTIGDVVNFLNKEVVSQLSSGYYADYLGESRQFIQEGNALAITFIIALLIIYLLLAIQFESFKDPMVILVSVPLAVSGALVFMAWGLTTMNIYTQIGLITLIGLITKHGILICEVAKHEQLANKKNKKDAVLDAANLRLRPILMTTFSMVAGLLPLLFASGPGAASRFSIGLVIMSGLGIGTLFTLYVLPVFYSLIATEHSSVKNINDSYM